MFSNVLVAVDGSECSKRAAKLGFALAERYDAAVDVVHAKTPAGEEAGQSVLADVADLSPSADVDVETHLVEGEPANAIASQVAERGADLVVMGRQGRSGLAEHLLGSTTEKVLRRTDVPVLLAPGPASDSDVGDDAEVDVANVLLTTDGSDVAEHAAPWAESVAERFGATLHFLTVVDVQAASGVFDAGGVSPEFVERLEDEGREAVDRLRDGVDAADVRTAVVRGTPHSAIAEYAADEGIDLLVMSSKGESNLAGQHLGSTTNRVLRTVTRPVLVVPAGE